MLLKDITTVEHCKEDTFDQLLSVVAESGNINGACFLLLVSFSLSQENTVDPHTHFLYQYFSTFIGDTTSIQFKIPQYLTQKMIDKAVTDKDWNRLYVLFMGGGGEQRFDKGSGGLGTGCDARNIPLERIIHCDFPHLETFMKILLDHNAVAREDLLSVATQLKKFEVAKMLMDEIPTAVDIQSARVRNKP